MAKKQIPTGPEQPPPPEAIQVLVSAVAADPNQPRKKFDPDQLVELASSVRSSGILQPPLIRPWPASAGDRNGFSYMIVAGERRWRAAGMAGLEYMPAIVRDLSDDEAREIQAIENVQRTDLTPIEEAASYETLLATSRDVAHLAERVGKSRDYVAIRLKLIELIEPVKEFLAADRITLAHALEIARLPEVVQEAALDACFPWEWDSGKRQNVPNRTKPVESVAQLREWISRRIILDLKKAPWKLDDETLVAEQGACSACQYNTAAGQTLFGELSEGTYCTNPIGFERKTQAWIARQAEKIQAEDNQPAAFLSTEHYIAPHGFKQFNIPEDTLVNDKYQELKTKLERECGFARRGIFVHGERRGRVTWVCAEKNCKDHLGRYNRSLASSVKKPDGTKTVDYGRLKKLRERKQELFDARVAEEVRLRALTEAADKFDEYLTVMRPAAKAKGVPREVKDRRYLDRAAAEFWVRIPSDHQHSVRRAFRIRTTPKGEGNYPELNGEAHHVKAAVKWVAALNERELFRFMFVCSHAHLSANTGKIYGAKKMDEARALAEERGVNWRLIDAQVRVEMCPSRKYKAAHDEYLKKVEAGDERAKPPLVYEPVVVPKEAKASAKKGAAKKGGRKKSVAEVPHDPESDEAAEGEADAVAEGFDEGDEDEEVE